MKADLPNNEAERLQALRRYDVLDTAPEPGFDDLTQVAAQICEAPIALITLLDEKRQWFKSRYGLPFSETDRDLAFCAHSILGSDLMEVADATQDRRFKDNALVTGPPHFRFYAGVPLRTREGLALGSLAVLDYVPRTLREDQRQALRALSHRAMAQLEMRRQLQLTTEQFQSADAELRRVEQRLRLAVRATNDVIWDWDLLVNTMWWNENFGTSFGYSPEQIGSGIESWSDRLHPDDLPRVKQGVARVLEGTDVRWSDEYRFRRADGSYAEILDRGFVIRDGTGKPVRAVGAMLEITERKHAENALREAETKYRAIFDNSNEGIFQTTPEGRLISGNYSLARILGYASPEELIRERTNLDLQGYRDPTLREKFKRVIGQQGFINNFEYESFRKDGTPIWLSENARLVRDAAGNLVCYEGSLQDITARKQAEEAVQNSYAELERKVSERTAELQAAKERAEAADRQKSQFLANMSHELRTPLNAIIGYTGTLLMKLPGALNARQEEQLSVVQSSGRHLLSLINDLLDLAKIESGKMQVEAEPVACRALLEEVAAMLRPLAAHKGLDLVLELPPAEIEVRSDACALKQILLNLANNAIKFTETGSVTLQLGVSDLGRTLEFGVADTGIGIAVEDHDKMFQLFSQMDSTRREGTGLGLHVSQKLAGLIGGKIRFQSIKNQGSRFWLTLPVE